MIKALCPAKAQISILAVHLKGSQGPLLSACVPAKKLNPEEGREDRNASIHNKKSSLPVVVGCSFRYSTPLLKKTKCYAVFIRERET